MPDTPDSQVPQAGLSPSSTPPSQPATTPPPASFQPVATTPPAPYQPITAPPPKQGPSALKIVLIIVAIFVGLGLIGAGFVAYGVYKVAHAMRMADQSQPVTESELGVAIYPGATQGKGTFRMKIAGKSMVTASFLTPDSKDQVLAFYQSNIGPTASTTTNANGGGFMITKGSGETINVTVTQNPALHNDETQIIIVHAGGASSSN